MKKDKLYLVLLVALVSASCKKEEPIEWLTGKVGSVAAEMRTGLSNRSPLVGDTVTYSTTTWQKDDEIKKVEYGHMLYEDFGIVFKLTTTEIVTNAIDDPRMIISDTITPFTLWFTTDTVKAGLNSFYNTEEHAYSIPSRYTSFDLDHTNYPEAGDPLLDKLSDESYLMMLYQLSLVIRPAEYLVLFPGSPDAHFTMSGATRTGLSATGRENLHANLSRTLLKTKGYTSIRKKGTLFAVLTSRVTTKTGVVSELTNTIKASYQ